MVCFGTSETVVRFSGFVKVTELRNCVLVIKLNLFDMETCTTGVDIPTATDFVTL